jgi:tellurite resistance protein
MRFRRHQTRFDLSPAEVIAEYCHEREEVVLDAIVTAAALVSRADNWVQPVEQAQLLDFLDRHDLASMLSRRETAELFERRLREIREPNGLSAALIRLRRIGAHAGALLVVDLSDEVAAADCRLDPREERMLVLIRAVLAGAHTPLTRSHRRRTRH